MENKEISKLTKSALESKKREVIKDWVASGKIESEMARYRTITPVKIFRL